MSEHEERDAARLAAFLEGKDGPIAAEDAEVAGLLRHAGGVASRADDRLFARIRASSRPRPRRTWAWASGAAAAAAVFAWLAVRPSPPPPLPAGPTLDERGAAVAALDPSYGPIEARLAALNTVAGRERARLVAELTHAP